MICDKICITKELRTHFIGWGFLGFLSSPLFINFASVLYISIMVGENLYNKACSSVLRTHIHNIHVCKGPLCGY